MLDYIYEILDTFDNVYTTGGGTRSHPKPVISFMFDEYCKKPYYKQDVKLHHLMMKILFATKQAIPYIYTTISFLTTTVREPYNDYYYKLVQII